MTRREFVKTVIGMAIGLLIGAGWLLARMAPPKFLLALGVKRYPGSLVQLRDVDQQGKWNG